MSLPSFSSARVQYLWGTFKNALTLYSAPAPMSSVGQDTFKTYILHITGYFHFQVISDFTVLLSV